MKISQSSASEKDKEYALAMGTALREERKKQKIGIELAAKTLKITASYISQIENGKKNPTLSVLENYADFLGLDLFELSLRVKIIRSPDRKSIKQLISELSSTIDTLAELNGKRN
jgi:transcriptional regulator with XRE-family HTH domain